jgi:hypothetical protein
VKFYLMDISLAAVQGDQGRVLSEAGIWEPINPSEAVSTGCEVTETDFREMLMSDGASMPNF